MKKTLSNKQRKLATKKFPKAKREEHQFGPKDYSNLKQKNGGI